MNTKCLLIFKILTVLSWLAYADKWAKFRRSFTFDGLMCQGTEILFAKEIVKDVGMCLFECTLYPNCNSIFYVEGTGLCSGCSVTYIVSVPTGTVEGSIYYEHEKCQDGWFNIKDSCYFMTNKMTFDEGVTACHSKDANPVVIETVDENSSLKSKLRLLSTTETLSAVFMAYTDAANEGTWTVTGTSQPMTIQDWYQKDPNGGTSENCVAFYEPADFKWVDISCLNAYKMICEKKILK